MFQATNQPTYNLGGSSNIQIKVSRLSMFHLELVIRRKPEAINQTPVTRSYNYQCMPYIKGETNGYEALDSQLKVRFLVYKPISCNNKHLANTFLNDRGRALQLAKVSPDPTIGWLDIKALQRLLVGHESWFVDSPILGDVQGTQLVQPVISAWTVFQWIGFRENLQDSPIFHGADKGFQ